jgi:hypothetical protein
MIIVNLNCDYYELVNMIEVIKDCANGDDGLAKLDHWLDCAVDSVTFFENRLAIIRAIYPDYQYNPHSLFSDMAPEEE